MKKFIFLLSMIFFMVNLSQSQSCFLPVGCNTVTNINYSMGIDDNGNQLPVGAIDPDWVITAAPASSNLVVTPNSGLPSFAIPVQGWWNWGGNNPALLPALQAGQWLSPFPTGTYITNNPNNPFTFTYTFCVCTAGFFNFNGLLHADDQGNLFVDGTQIGTTTGANNITQYNSTMFLAVGTHTLTFDLFNTGSVAMGANVNGAITALGAANLISNICCNPAGQLNGTKYSDVDGDGMINPNIDTVITNWTFNLTDNQGNVFTTTTNIFGQYNFTNIPPGNYTLSEVMQPGWTAVIPATGSIPVTVTAGNVLINDFLNSNCACGDWSDDGVILTDLSSGQQTILGCDISIAKQLSAFQSYTFRYEYLCDPNNENCEVTYVVNSDLNGTVTTSVNNGVLTVTVTPNEHDCGIHYVEVIPYCGGQRCKPCSLYFRVVDCHECVEPVEPFIYCSEEHDNNPVISFCLRNIASQPRSFFGITLPAGVGYTNITPVGTANLIYTSGTSGMMVFQTPAPVPVGGVVCSFQFVITSGIYKGQELCLDLKSFTFFQDDSFFLNCCIDPIPLCFTIPDCPDECADILEAEIHCDFWGNRVLTYSIRNNGFFQIGAFEHFTVNGTPPDYFFGPFSPPVLQGNVSNTISHTIPTTIAGGTEYCFTTAVHMYIDSNGHPCDSICYSDTVCLTVPFCKKWPDDEEDDNYSDSYEGSDDSGIYYGNLDDKSLGNSSILESREVEVFPNPTDGMLNIQMDRNSIINLELYSITGSLIKSISNQELKKNQILPIDMTTIPSGMYLLMIKEDTNSIIKKIIIE